MTTNYPVGDFLIRLKNAARAEHKEVSLPKSKLIVSVAEVLKREKYLDEVKVDGDTITVRLTFKSKKPLLMDIKLVSKLGLRIYQNVDELGKHRGASFLIVSTPDGVLSSREAIKKNVGGEVIAEIW